ncbi:MAG: acyltransferase domain-containing protein, partial [Acaryochloris sp. CRU_2_0]|nr:acyltransferase domain-containing protein [Acaryochloris sp. CRU_2_0]
MGQQLYTTQPTFRRALDRCHEILKDYLEKPLLEVLFSNTSHLLHETVYTQPALFSLEYALTQLWHSWGIYPQAVLGHSLGEYAAACCAGVFSLEDGLRLVSERGRLMDALPKTGTMVAVFAGQDQVNAFIQGSGYDVAIAAVNGPRNTVVSGQDRAIAALVQQLKAAGIATKTLQVSQGFHSPLMEPIVAAFAAVARTVTYCEPTLDVVTNLTGAVNPSAIASPDYWIAHICQPVQFAASIETLQQQDYEVFIEIGPKPTLLNMAKQMMPEGFGVWLPSLRTDQEAWLTLLQSLGQLYVQGATINWQGFDQDYPRRKLNPLLNPLPTYPFQRQHYWIDAQPGIKRRHLETPSFLHDPFPKTGETDALW